MGYRGEDVSTTHGDWRRQTPWQPASDTTPGNAGAWDDGSRGYSGDENYPAVDGGGFSYPPDGGHPGQGQQGYGPQDGQYGNPYGQQPYEQPYEQQPYEQHGEYGPEPGQGGGGGYGGPPGYAQHDGYGYERGANPPPGYGQTAGYDQTARYDQTPGYDQSSGYDQRSYDQRPAPGYGPGGNQDPNGGYGQPAGYPALPAGGGGYPAPSASGRYPALPSGSGGYPAEDAGNDWYGGQPAAAKGASFADTGSYALNGRVSDEYGTGPRGALRDPALGFPPGPAQGSGPLPVSANPAPAGPQAFQRPGAPSVAETRQQERYDENKAYPEYGQDEPAGRPPRAASGGFQGAPTGGFQGNSGFQGPPSGGFQGTGGRDAFDGQGEYDDYQNGFNELAAADDDPYQDRYGDAAGPRAAGGGRGANRSAGGQSARGPLGGKRLLFAALGVVAVGIIGVAAYVFLFNSSSPASNSDATGPLPSAGAEPSSEQACAKQLGTYCHIESATDDPTPLTTAELFPPAFTNETDKTSYQLVSTKLDKTCSNAVIGPSLITALKSGKCSQVLRASYVSGDNKIMGTIGVVNLSTTNEAHDAGKVVGQNDFIAPLTSAKGVASKLGNGTGVVEAEFKGHYLILTWSEFVNGTDPTTTAEDNQLEQFSNDLVAGTANVDLSQRMVTGAAATPSATAK
jgi:hypothetical protein